MILNDFGTLSSLWIPAVAAIAIMLMEPFTSAVQKKRLAFLAVLAAAVSVYCLQFQRFPQQPPVLFHGMLLLDGYSSFFQWLFLIIVGACITLSIDFNERELIHRGEYYSLLLLSGFGMSLMVMSGDLILTFLGLEILSISTYILAGFKRFDTRSNEASLKYFMLGSFATAILLFGISLIYGSAGSTNYATIRELTNLQGEIQSTFYIGLGLLLVGFCFKIALVPFHSWVPDVYEGAPTPVTAFMAVGPKAAGFAALLRILAQALPFMAHEWSAILWAVSLLTMTLGNIVAILQKNIKRMLAYSAIAHAGYILIGIAIHSQKGYAAVLFYLVVYSAMNLVAFSVILSLSGKGDQRVFIEDYAGLGRRSPFAAAALAVALISLAGIPLTGGFLAKLFILSAAIQKGYIAIVIVAVLNSTVSVFYYFRILVYMYMREPEEELPEPEPIGRPVQALTCIGMILILWLGIHPDSILKLAGYSSLALK
jgi:NADH-quinone oxidoreductase subunit N